LFQSEALSQIQELVDIDSTYRNIGQTLKEELSEIDSHEIVADVKNILPILEKKLQRQFHKRTIFGAIFHICCLIDGLKKGCRGNEFPDQDIYEENYSWEHSVIRETIQPIEEKYQVTISAGEISYMVSLFITYPQAALS
jgi:transcriptional regulatory protein LevR